MIFNLKTGSPEPAGNQCNHFAKSCDPAYFSYGKPQRHQTLFLSLAVILLSFLLVDCSTESKKNSEDTHPVYLNHLYRVVDSESYEALRTSPFINNEFAHYELRTTTSSKGDSWTGIYLYGEDTYMEFFDVGAGTKPSVTITGIGFGVEENGAIKHVQRKLKKEFDSQIKITFQPRALNGNDVPWFHYTGVKPDYNGTTDLVTWVMEYHPDFLKQWHNRLPPVQRNIKRCTILSRYKAKVESDAYDSKRYFKNIKTVSMNLNPTDFNRFTGELSAFNYDLSFTASSRDQFIASGPDITFHVSKTDSAQAGITKIEISLHKPKSGQKVYQFGPMAELEFANDSVAYWKFENR